MKGSRILIQSCDPYDSTLLRLKKVLSHHDVAISEIKKIRSFRFDVETSPEHLFEFADKALCDPIVEKVVTEKSVLSAQQSFLLIRTKFGVTDDEGYRAQELWNDFWGFSVSSELDEQNVFSEMLFVFEKEIEANEERKIENTILAGWANPLIEEVFVRKTHLGFPPVFTFDAPKPCISHIPLPKSHHDLLLLSENKGLQLDTAEMLAIFNYYEKHRNERIARGVHPDPSEAELEVFAQTWSEHCKHKEFDADITYLDKDAGTCEVIPSLFKSTIVKATQEIKQTFASHGGSWLLSVFSDNAGVVRIDKDRALALKVETHNSPSALDPYGGALTGVLGNNRDAFGTGKGGAKLLFNTNVLCFGNFNYSKPLYPNQMHPARIKEGVCKGIQDAGNKTGTPTIAGAVLFDDRYAGKPLVYCGTASIMPNEVGTPPSPSWQKEILPGYLIVMVGGRVGKDGIHGATFSSAALDEKSNRTAVQIGSPYTQKLLSDFLEKVVNLGLVSAVTDNGAGGLSSSVGELARISKGANVYLERVPLKYQGLQPWEILLSESQERMTLAVKKEHEGLLKTYAKTFQVECSTIGSFEGHGRFDVFYNNQTLVSLDLDFLEHGCPKKKLLAEWSAPVIQNDSLEVHSFDVENLLLSLLKSPNICSREPILRRFDHEVRGRTVLKPLMGVDHFSPQDGGVVQLDFDSYLGVAVAHGICPKYGDIDAYEMSAGAFDEALRSLVSMGISLPDPKTRPDHFIAGCDNFCVPDSVYDAGKNPDGKYKLAQLVRMCKALYRSSSYFLVPMISGKDSMKNDFRYGSLKISIPPTVLYTLVGRVDDVRKLVSSDAKVPGAIVYLLGETYEELGATEFSLCVKKSFLSVPKVNLPQAFDLYTCLNKAQEMKLVSSCHDLSDGGLAVGLAEILFAAELGASISLTNSDISMAAHLFGESHSRFVATVLPEHQKDFEGILAHRATAIGVITEEPRLVIRSSDQLLCDLATDRLYQAFGGGLTHG